MHLHEVLPPAGFHQYRLGRPLPHLHPRLGIDVHQKQHVPVEDTLQIRRAVLRLGGLGQFSLGLGVKRLSQQVHRRDQPLRLRRQRLGLHIVYRDLLGKEMRTPKEHAEKKAESRFHGGAKTIRPAERLGRIFWIHNCRIWTASVRSID